MVALGEMRARISSNGSPMLVAAGLLSIGASFVVAFVRFSVA
jgi:hypothetical protein